MRIIWFCRVVILKMLQRLNRWTMMTTLSKKMLLHFAMQHFGQFPLSFVKHVVFSDYDSIMIRA